MIKNKESAKTLIKQLNFGNDKYLGKLIYKMIKEFRKRENGKKNGGWDEIYLVVLKETEKEMGNSGEF